MSEWKVSDLCQIIGGGTPKTSIPEYWNGDICWLSVKDFVGDSRYVYDTERKITELGLNNSSTKLLQKDDIIISARGTVGEMAMIPYPMTFNQSCFGLRGNEKVDKTFFYYLLKTKIKNLKKQANGAVFDTITISTFNNIICNIPSLSTQHRIASILSSLDDKIAVNRRICENLEAQAQALFKHWFIDFAPFKDGKFVESELGMIPEGWRVGTLSDIGEIVGGATPSKAEQSYYCNDGIHWLTPKDLSNCCCKFTSRGEIDITQEGYKSCSAKIMPKGSVLFSSRAPIGYVTIAKNDICTNQGFKSVVPKYAGTAFIYYLLKLNTKRIESMATGTTFKEASGSLMKSLSVILPPKSLLDKFEINVKEVFEEQEIIEQESSRLSTLRDTLLPKLMSGQIKV